MTNLRQAEPVAVYGYCPDCGAKGVTRERRPNGNDKCANGHTYPSSTATPVQPKQQAETPPEWPLVKNILDEYGLDAIAFVAEFKAAQRPWVGLTDKDWGWVADRKGTSLDSFDQGAAWAQQRLQERNT